MDEITEVLQIARKAFKSNITRNLEFRKQQLRAIHRLLTENEDLFIEALEIDLRKNRMEVISYELEMTKNELVYQLKNIDQYIERRPVEKVGFTVKDTPFLKYEPYGVVLIIGPWNFPVQLVMIPLAAAILAGNCAIIKPSEVTPNTEHLITELIPQYLDKKCFHVINGGPKETEMLLRNKFDYIFFTGSTKVGKIVYESAAKHLTPVTLELGGKSPLWIDETVPDLEVACRRLLWAKVVNLGQVCVAPDYVLTTAKFQSVFVKTAIKILKEFCGEDPQSSEDLARIVNTANFERVAKLLNNTKGKVVFGGITDPEDRYVSPTIVTDVPPDDSLLSEEIFGPILPILVVSGVDEAIDYILAKDKPLALYVYSTDEHTIDRFVDQTSSGVFCANDSIINLMVDSLPFGGVGSSGIGNYHGKWSFETFSHIKGTLIRGYDPEIEEMTKNRYLPYNDQKTETLKTLNMKELPE